MDTTLLEDLGLSKGEIKTYLALLELGASKVGKIIKKSGLASSAVHNALHALLEKGLASFIKKGKIKYYRAAPPKQIVDFIDERKEKIMTLLPELELKQKFAEERQDAEIFSGTKGVMTLLNQLIEGSQKGDDYLFFATALSEKNEEIQKFFHRFDLKRKEKGLVVRGLAPLELKSLFQGRPILKMKYPPFPLPSDLSICNDKIALIAWGEKPIGYLITSRQIAMVYQQFFELIWQKC